MLISSFNIANDDHQYHQNKVYNNLIMIYISSVLSIQDEWNKSFIKMKLIMSWYVTKIISIKTHNLHQYFCKADEDD